MRFGEENANVSVIDNYTSLPVIGEDSVIYITRDESKQYYWDNNQYIPLTAKNSGGSGISNIRDLPEYTVGTNLAPIIKLPAGGIGIIILHQGGLPITEDDYDFDAVDNEIVILSTANLRTGDKITGKYYTAGTVSTGGGGSTITGFTTSDDEYPNQQLTIVDTSGNHTINTKDFGSMQYVYWESPYDDDGNRIPYQFTKNVVYYEASTGSFYRATNNYLMSAEDTEFGISGSNFDYVDVVSFSKLNTVEQTLITRMDNLPGKMPRFHTTLGTTMTSSDTINPGGNGATMNVYSNYELPSSGRAIRYDSTVNGRGYAINLKGFNIDFARGATINNWHISNGNLVAYGESNRAIIEGSLTNVTLKGIGGQKFTLYGVPLNYQAGQVLAADGIQLELRGTKGYPVPVIPDGVILNGTVPVIVPYRGEDDTRQYIADEIGVGSPAGNLLAQLEWLASRNI